MLNEFFENIVVLTTHRRERCEVELAKYGIKAQYMKSLQYHPKKSFNMSMLYILTSFVESGKDTVLILEDDVVFQNMHSIDMCLDELTDECPDWDILYLGGNYNNRPDAQKPEHISEHLRRIYNAWTTHAVAYKRSAAMWLVNNYEPHVLYDAWLDEYALKKFKTVATYPLFAVQEQGYSSLWGREVDYTGTWEQSTDFIR
jgi:GR25 family glycosyltransferase involved in LPS biosynthesis